MCRASAFQSGDRHQSHVCVVCAWLNVGELPRFDNQPQRLAALLSYPFLLFTFYDPLIALLPSANDCKNNCNDYETREKNAHNRMPVEVWRDICFSCSLHDVMSGMFDNFWHFDGSRCIPPDEKELSHR
jgi:hypothetical protein